MRKISLLLSILFFSSAAYASDLLPMNINAPETTISCSSASSSVEIPTKNASTLVIYNDAAVRVFLKTGDSSVTSSTTDAQIPPYGWATYLKTNVHTHIACITSSGSGTVYIKAGTGE